MGAADEPVLNSTPVAIERLLGAPPLYLVQAERGDRLTAAKWRLKDLRGLPEASSACVLAYCTKGDAWVTRCVADRDVRRHMGPGDAALSLGNAAARWSVEGTLEVVHVYFEPGRFELCARKHGSPVTQDGFWCLRDIWLDGYFQMLAYEVEAARHTRTPAALPLLEQSLSLLLEHLVQAATRQPEATPASFAASRISPLRPAVRRRVEAYIAANLAREISLQALADIACMSVDHFARSFRAAQGEAPYRYVLTQRLRHAASLLATTSAPIATVAARCGFRSAAHFTATFTDHFGVSPSRHRRSFWDE